jgi:hypothetical protein
MRAFLIKGGFRPVERERRKSEKRERERRRFGPFKKEGGFFGKISKLLYLIA